jgi:hypothetical protein
MKQLFFLMLFSISCFGQAPGIEWQKTIGLSNRDFIYSIKQTTDDGYIAAGWSLPLEHYTFNNIVYDFWVIKLDNVGNVSWQKTLGGSDDDQAKDIQQTIDGGYIVTGHSRSDDGDLTFNNGSWDVWVIKLDNNGNVTWQKTLGGSNEDASWSIQQTTDGGYIIAGQTSSNDGDLTGNNGFVDFWVVKLDELGSISWQKSLGGTGDDRANSIQQTTDGGYILTGRSSSNDGDVTGNNGLYDFWVVKLDSAGNFDWQKSLGGSGEDRGNSIKQTTDGGYIVAGWSIFNDGDVTGNHGLEDFWIVKLDNVGNISWQKSLGGTNKDLGVSAQQTNDGGYILTGKTLSNDGDVMDSNGSADFWIVKLSELGDIEWQKSLGGANDDIACSIIQTSDGYYTIAGLLNTDYNYAGGSSWIVKLGPVSAIEELVMGERTLVKILNILGQETEVKDNCTLIYVYSDGSIEKVCRME